MAVALFLFSSKVERDKWACVCVCARAALFARMQRPCESPGLEEGGKITYTSHCVRCVRTANREKAVQSAMCWHLISAPNNGKPPMPFNMSIEFEDDAQPENSVWFLKWAKRRREECDSANEKYEIIWSMCDNRCTLVGFGCEFSGTIWRATSIDAIHRGKKPSGGQPADTMPLCAYFLCAVSSRWHHRVFCSQTEWSGIHLNAKTNATGTELTEYCTTY